MAQTKPEQHHSPATPYDILATLLQKLAFDEFASLDSASFLEEDCSCDSCKNKSTSPPETIEEIKMIQSCWLELRQYIRIVYRLSMKGSLKSIDHDYQNYMKDIVARLFEVCDPHQLYQKLEAQVKEFIIEVKILLLQILDRMSSSPRLPQIFLSGMLDRYNKIMNAATVIAPVLCQLEEKHLNKFSLNWKLLNKRLFQTVIYSDVFFQNSVPLFISQLGKGKRASECKGLVKEFLVFDNEIGLVEGQWVEIESSIVKYLRVKTEKCDSKKKFLIPDWEEFRTLRKLENLAILDNPMFGFNGKRIHTHDAHTDGVDPELLSSACECHVCSDTSHHHHHHLHHHHHHHAPVELIEQVIPLGAHRGAFHLYPPIHATKGVPEFGPFLPDCEIPELCGKITEQQLWQGTLPKGAKFNKLEHVHSLPKHLHHHHSNIKKRVDKATQKDQEVINTSEDSVNIENHKPTPGVTHIKENGADITHLAHHHPHVHCSKHTDMKRIPFPPERHHHHHDDEVHPPDDSRSDHSQSDPHHCDCCYCEVFGHAVPSPPPTAPMSKNYQEMRERLRLLLNKKKSKCKTNPTPAQQAQTQLQRKQHPTAGSQPTNPPPESDTREIDDLLDFIEGNEVKCRNEKKAAKKARQKEKKRIMMIRKKKEEEEKEKEKARLLEQAIQKKKREEALARELEEKNRFNSNNKSKKKNSKTNSNNKATKSNSNNSSNNHNQSNEKVKESGKPGPQMVTIKRVMEPHNSEPTVTITLRGATPNQDRVLYTLLNGQVCKMKDTPNDRKGSNPKTPTNTNTKNAPVNVSYKIKEPTKEKANYERVKHNKDNMKHERAKQPAPMPLIKPPKELTNPTSIQINNAINNMSKKASSSSFNINDIKLPPGITITKVDPSNVQSRSSKIQENNMKKMNTNHSRPSSEVIVVSTGKHKDSPIIKEPILPETQAGKKKRNKKKASSGNPNDGKGSAAYPGLEIQPVKIIDSNKDRELANRMSVLTISPYADNNSDNLESNKKKKKKPKKSEPCNTINPEEWKLLDSVFAPKDIDLDDNEIDDAERELEAFKRFCLQSIPPERKEKVHLNIKDIVLKKKATTYNY